MIKSISHFHDHVGFENRIKDPKYELYGEVLVKTSSKYDISKVKKKAKEPFKKFNYFFFF